MTPGDLLTIQHREGIVYRFRSSYVGEYQGTACDMVLVESSDGLREFPAFMVVASRETGRWKSAPPDTGPRVVQSLVDRPERGPTE